ncbi:MAG: hypothetical protein WC804_09920 [Sphingomonas sp.]|jgi:hypothetical protein
MERNFHEATVVDAASDKAVWNAPQVAVTDIEAITAAGAGANGDGVTTAS